jgi:hypothetical protein
MTLPIDSDYLDLDGYVAVVAKAMKTTVAEVRESGFAAVPCQAAQTACRCRGWHPTARGMLALRVLRALLERDAKGPTRALH